MRNRMLVLVLVGICAIAGSGNAHNEWGLANPDFNRPDLPTQQQMGQLRERQTTKNARYVLERAQLWAPGSVLQACFKGGTAENRAAVVTAVQDMQLKTHGVNIDFNFGQAPNYRDCGPGSYGQSALPVRISFEDACCAGYVGRVSLYPNVATGPSVFLAGPPQKFVIQHEMMHTLGAWEHQSPAAKCENELKIDEIARAWNWDRQKVIDNVKRLNANERAFLWSPDDKASITRYHFEPKFLFKGAASPCYSDLNTSLSQLDYLGLRIAYPTGPDLAAHNQKLRSGAAVVSGFGTIPPGVKFLVDTVLQGQ
jgi:hypothetical protein